MSPSLKVVMEEDTPETRSRQQAEAQRELAKAEKEIRTEIETMARASMTIARASMTIAYRLADLYEHRTCDVAAGDDPPMNRSLIKRDTRSMGRLVVWAKLHLNIDRRYVNNLLDAVAVARALEAGKSLEIGAIAPISETQLRPLVKVLKDGQRDPGGRVNRAWRAAINGDNKPPTEAKVRAAVKALNPGPVVADPSPASTPRPKAKSGAWRDSVAPVRAAMAKAAKAAELDGVVRGADRDALDDAIRYVEGADVDALLYALALHMQTRPGG